MLYCTSNAVLAGGMTGADVGIGWVDATGKIHFQTTNDWFALQGREQDGWTAIQFNRRLNTCDSMDVPIKVEYKSLYAVCNNDSRFQSGTNVLIYAYGLVDPDGDITYHEDRRGSRMIPLQSYANPPTEDKFADLEYFEFRLNNGGQRTQDEMCSHSFTYYPRINNVYVCMTCTHPEAWQTMRNETLVNYNYGDVMQWIKSIEWTPTIAAQWQEFFNNAPRHIYYGLTENLSWEKFDMPKYKDLETESCPMVLVPNIEKLG
ncbi:unnamed protein product [Rotaria sp. Silwood1]|nr:unnamed protein product [Rotaria sp. Silwood1]